MKVYVVFQEDGESERIEGVYRKKKQADEYAIRMNKNGRWYSYWVEVHEVK